MDSQKQKKMRQKKSSSKAEADHTIAFLPPTKHVVEMIYGLETDRECLQEKTKNGENKDAYNKINEGKVKKEEKTIQNAMNRS
jgi:hypothetical protein